MHVPGTRSTVEHMFDPRAPADGPRAPGPLTPGPLGPGRSTRPLPVLAARARPISDRTAQLLPVIPALAPLLPRRGLPRGHVVGVLARTGGGGTTLALGLAARATTAGSWCVVVGRPDIGAWAADELSMDLEHVAVVPDPGTRAATAVASLLDDVDLIVWHPPGSVGGAQARRLAARLRVARSTLIVLDSRPWPVRPDVTLRIERSWWVGAGRGPDHLTGRQATVTATDRSGHRARTARLWLPGPDGAIQLAGPDWEPGPAVRPDPWQDPRQNPRQDPRPAPRRSEVATLGRGDAT